MIYLLSGLLAFLAGVAVGITLPEGARLAVRSPFGLVRSGHNRGMANSPRPRRTTLLVLVLAALVVNAGLGFLQIATRAAVEDQAREDAARVDCQGRYNRELGLALEDRDAAVRAGTDAHIALWTEYRRLYALASKDPSKIPAAQARLNDAVGDMLKSLDTIQRTRARNPYPDPDLCRLDP